MSWLVANWFGVCVIFGAPAVVGVLGWMLRAYTGGDAYHRARERDRARDEMREATREAAREAGRHTLNGLSRPARHG
ncbi:MAG: hypothetical protein HIU92_06425 [Proteobacteria bacterium]|nr:hypothetical protein [Pseudomonadota bacterium]